jgi:Raf kinase inhibitor-like YbhB/YbcL family protein
VPKNLIASILYILILILTSTACTLDNRQEVQEIKLELEIRLISSAFTDGEMIPKKYTCDAENVSPPLSWSDIPEGTESLALIVDDPDAPAGTWVHWILYDIPADQNGLSEGVQGVGIEGTNNFGDIGYGGPCPPKGPAHRYFFKIYTLATTLELDAGESKENLERAMEGHILAQGQLMGQYQR